MLKWQKMIFTTFSQVESKPINESAEDLEYGITEEPLMKKSKAEELNDILCRPEGQHLNRVQENVLTHMKKKKYFRKQQKNVPKS